MDVLGGVHLDPKNVRLENVDAKVEADIIEDMFANEGALDLVEGICKVGYLTHETPVVIERDGKYVVVEGNRRLAALKAIQNPMLAPDFQARISAQTATLADRDALARIRVLVAPSQTDADQLVAAIHTSNLRKPWGPARQAAFFQAQIDAGRSLEELLRRYPTIDVKRFVFRAQVLNLFRDAQYPDPALSDFLATKQWTRGLSALARIYESKEFLNLTGIKMGDDGTLTMAISGEAFDEVAGEIVRGMYDGDINTRSLNTVKSSRYKQLLSELTRIVTEVDPKSKPAGPPRADGEAKGRESPTGAKGGATRADPSSSTSGRGAPSQAAQNPPATGSQPASSGAGASARKKKQRKLDLSQIRTPDQYPEAMKLLLAELSEIDVQKFPNATYLTIRAAMEKAIKSFAEAKDIDIKGSGNNANGYVQLGHTLSWLLGYVKENGPTYLRQVIEDVRTGKLVAYSNTKDSLDAANHNNHFKVDADQTLSMWGSVEPIMRYVTKL